MRTDTLACQTLRPLHLLPSGHLSAASGLVQVQQRLVVVADDELALGIFDLQGQAAGMLLPLLPGQLPPDPKARKAAKPDFEALALLPPWPARPGGALLAMGSGSRPQRQRAVLLPLAGGSGQVIDLAPLYAPLHAEFGKKALNIEGAFVAGKVLLLLQRGNRDGGVNASIAFDWIQVTAWLAGQGPAPAPLALREHKLGNIDGVPLCFTDGSALPGGGWVFSAAAENTADTYRDGPNHGSAVGVIDAHGKLVALRPLALPLKVEGVTAALQGGNVQLLLVTDGDDRNQPAQLLSAQFES